MKRSVVAGVAAALLIGAAVIQSDYDDKIHYSAARRVTVNLPKAQTLKVMSLGFSDAVAELLFIWSIQFYSTTHYSNRWESVESVFNTIADLSPDKADHYLTGAFIMSLEAKDIEAAIRLLLKAANHFKNDFIYEYYAGYYAGFFLKDYKRATALYKKSSERANAPPRVFNHYAHYVFQDGNLDEAWDLWMRVKETATSETAKIGADNHLYQIRFIRDQEQFAKLIAPFRDRQGRMPHSFEELIEKKYLSEIPLDYKGDPYGFDPQNGKLIANKKLAWK